MPNALRTLATVLFAAVVTGPTLAGELQFERTLDLHGSGVGLTQESLAVPTFPAELGKLLEVRVEVGIEHGTALALEHLNKGNFLCQSQQADLILVSLDDQTAYARQLNVTNYDFLGPFDGELDYSGSSGTIQTHTIQEKTTSSLPATSSWLSSGDRDRVELRLDYLRAYSAPGQPSLAVKDLGGRVQADVRVTYVYAEQSPNP